MKYSRSPSLPLYGQSVGVPLVALGRGCKQYGRWRTEVQPFYDLIGSIGPFAVLVDAMECVLCSFHRQRGDDDSLAMRGMVEMREAIQRQMLLS